MEQGTCFFLGHRDAPEALGPCLAEAVARHITEYGVRDFVTGQYGAFDALAAAAVREAKRRWPQVTLTLLLPYHPALRPVALPPGFDGSYYPPAMESVPRRLAILRANRHMVDTADCLIAYAWQPGSNTGAMLEHAKRRAARGLLRLTNLAEVFPPPARP